MTVAVSLGKMPTSTTDVNLDLYALDFAKIGDKVRTQPNPTTTAYTYNYLSNSDYGARLQLFHNVTQQKGAIENVLGFTGSFVATDSETGLKSLLAPFTARTIVRMPSQMYVTPEHLAIVCSCLFALQFPSVSSGAASTATWARVLEGNSAW